MAAQKEALKDIRKKPEVHEHTNRLPNESIS
jgi:hypothetical protein